MLLSERTAHVTNACPDNAAKETQMNWTQIEGKWEQLRGDVKSRWGKLTDDDLKFVDGKLNGLVGKIVERYGVKKELAHKEVDEWADRLRARLDALGKAPEPDEGRKAAELPRR